MDLRKLVNGLDIELHEATMGGDRREITSITEDSRCVKPGSLFVARKGTQTDGRRFIDKAVNAGAVAVLTDPTVEQRSNDVAWLAAENVAIAASQLAERFFGNPSSKLKLIGVTGTNGKTTVVHLLSQLLNHANLRCGYIGTVSIKSGPSTVPATMTTPGPIELSTSLAEMVNSGCRAAAIEVSSHALDQNRTAALAFDVGIFTNLSGDHLDYHGTMNNYTQAKARLFASLLPTSTAIVNIDDARAMQVLNNCTANVLHCSLLDNRCDAFASAVHSASGMDVTLHGPWGKIRAHSSLIGPLNVQNLLLAVAAAHALGLQKYDIESAVPKLSPPPGRLERIEQLCCAQHGFAVLVDYAHTDDALAHALDAVRPLVNVPTGKLRVVMGCGGDRDRSKRPRMGKVAARGADVVYITSDNPRTEEPQSIINEVLTGCDSHQSQIHAIVERKVAIERAITETQPGDVVLIAGKGHEQYQVLPVHDTHGSISGTCTMHFDDKEVAVEAISRRITPAHTTQQPNDSSHLANQVGAV